MRDGVRVKVDTTIVEEADERVPTVQAWDELDSWNRTGPVPVDEENMTNLMAQPMGENRINLSAKPGANPTTC